ncbi:hypothetical protein F3Y22_tig00111372pilonHSYRG00229 [Hibiscus syriacus]|uniref:Methyltransferase n=1 Tax=Hibiscus syriacus TaxID=106335 RepID=A0A6A2YMY3_HIBSY|nr:hypothetical protein F3Y22_tig00111372pilonHSYRG00229 [Hibiscus syriacus]
MALGKYGRVDNSTTGNRRSSSSSYGSTVTKVVFVGFCLVGLWMMSSSSVVPDQNMDDVAHEKKIHIDDQGTGNLNTQENNGNTEESKLDESEKDKKQLDSEVERTNNNSGENFPKDASGAKDGDNNNSGENLPKDASGAKDGGTGNLNTPETEESESDESKKDKKQLDSEGGQTRVSENKTTEESNLDDSKKDKKLLDTEGGQRNNNDENLGGSGGSEENPNDKKSDPGESNEKAVSNENDKKSDSGSGEKKPDEKSSETNVDQNEKNEYNKKDSEGGLSNNNSGKDSEVNPDEKKSISEEGNNNAVFNDKNVNKSDSGGGEKKPDENSSGTNGTKVVGQIEGKSELLSETSTQNGSFSTQAAVSTNEKKTQLASKEYICISTAGPDFIPCLDNWKQSSISVPTNIMNIERGIARKNHLPALFFFLKDINAQLGGQKAERRSGIVTFPILSWHKLRVIRTGLNLGKTLSCDTGCWMWGCQLWRFLFDRNVLAMSFAPKDEHEAQVQFALEREIPAVSAVMGTKKLPYPGGVFDIVHCARCRVPWHIEGIKTTSFDKILTTNRIGLIEINRLLRPGGFFVWSATPVYQKGHEDAEIWKAMVELTEAMCWKLVKKTRKHRINRVAVAIFKKPDSNDCYNGRSKQEPPLCPNSDDPNAAW